MPGDYRQTEEIHLFGRFPSEWSDGNVTEPNEVTIQLCQFPGNNLVSLISDTCVETAIPGYWEWSTQQIDPGHLFPNHPNPVTLLYVMTDRYGQQFSGKAVLNKISEDARRAWQAIQTVL